MAKALYGSSLPPKMNHLTVSISLGIQVVPNLRYGDWRHYEALLCVGLEGPVVPSEKVLGSLGSGLWWVLFQDTTPVELGGSWGVPNLLLIDTPRWMSWSSHTSFFSFWMPKGALLVSKLCSGFSGRSTPGARPAFCKTWPRPHSAPHRSLCGKRWTKFWAPQPTLLETS